MPHTSPAAGIRGQLLVPLRFADGYATTAPLFMFDGGDGRGTSHSGPPRRVSGRAERAPRPVSGRLGRQVPEVRLTSPDHAVEGATPCSRTT